ncbi:uncharacterized protein PHALS_07008 [Plasmopara halstedii]|uniref:Uncharacterized protein n=1 Tax=Plasmopara halstedii TaxID=4781 RepID=A0A0P1B3B6_PLAHL|nr:uncharacterized protein PHALS_07008 [Plasmopara halstedii]CEG49236.1 hypothetical protein PHALS_07008 [Plasmopara halstedii]|eukprot:XP_024585605.1 hypothetical protein PHALS_07008 [Plasmopara halstedii]
MQHLGFNSAEWFEATGVAVIAKSASDHPGVTNGYCLHGGSSNGDNGTSLR